MYFSMSNFVYSYKYGVPLRSSQSPLDTMKRDITMVGIRQYDGGYTTVRWWVYDSTMVKHDSNMVTQRLYDDVE